MQRQAAACHASVSSSIKVGDVRSEKRPVERHRLDQFQRLLNRRIVVVRRVEPQGWLKVAPYREAAPSAATSTLQRTGQTRPSAPRNRAMRPMES